MARKPVIALYSDTYLPACDGVVSSIVNFRGELLRRGYEVYLFVSGGPGRSRPHAGEDNVFVIKGMRFKRYPQYSFALFPFMASLKINEINPDVIHAHTPFFVGVSALMTARLNKIPMVGTFHTMVTDEDVIREYAASNPIVHRLLKKYAWSYARFFYTRCNTVTAPTMTMCRLLSMHGIHGAKCVPNSVDIGRFSPSVDGAQIRRKLFGDWDGATVLYVGRLSKEKKVDTMIRAMAHLRERRIRAVIVGTGPAEHYYRRIAARMHLDNVKFAGFVPNGALPGYYAAADLFCMPSTFETQGIAAIEAMASGKPVVGADHLALKELIHDGKNGEKFAPGDSSDCARKIETVINNMDSYNTMRKTAEKFSIERATDRLLEIYGMAMEGMTLS